MRVRRFLALAAAALALPACGGTSAPASAPGAAPRPRAIEEVRRAAVDRPPVLFIGLDGGDWQELDRLMAAGRMPELARLVAAGRRFTLETEHPPLSPIVWTTMMTGVSPLAHGILDFSRFSPATGEREPIGSDERRAPAIWNLATWAGKRTVVLGLWATYPAEPVDGLLVADRFFGFLNVEAGTPPGAVYPRAELARAEQLRRSIERGVDLAALRAYLPQLTADDYAAHAETSRAYDHPVSALRRILIETRLYDALATRALAELHPDLAILYLQGTDSIGHVFAPFAPPRQPSIDAAEFERFRTVGETYFAEIDRLLGRYAAWASAHGATLVLASDHGFAWSEGRPARLSSVDNATAAKWHRREGIGLVVGPGIAPGREATPAGVRRLAATLAALAGIPPGRDLEGPPLVVPAGGAGGPALDYGKYFATTRLAAASVAAPSTAASEELAKLRALGYLGGAEPDRAPASSRGSTRTGGSFNNEGLIEKSLGRRVEAAAAFERALALDPRLASALWNLSELRFEEGDLDRADDLMARALEAKLPDGERSATERALAYAKRGDVARSLALLDHAVAALPDAARLRVFRGRFRVERRDCAGALADFEAAALIEPADPTAPASAGIALLCLGRPVEAAASLRRSLALDPDQPPVREFLARLERDGKR